MELMFSHKKRAVICKNIMPKLNNYKVIRLPVFINLNCACTINFLIKHLFMNFPSTIENTTCSLCSMERITSTSILTVNLPTENLDFLTDSIEAMFSNSKTCDLCSGLLSTDNQLQSHIFIEPIINMKNKKSNENLDLSIILNNIPKRLTILNKAFFIRGIVEFIPPAIKCIQSIGHFISYSYREHTNQWEKNDDLSNSIRTVRTNIKINHCLLLIYTI